VASQTLKLVTKVMIINYWTNASPTTRKSIYVMSIIFALIVIIVPSVWIQNTKRADNRMNAAVSDNNSLSENRLHVYIKLSVVNTDDYTYTLIMKITPFGNLSDTKSNLTRYNAQIDLSVKGQRFTFPKFSPAGLIEFKTNFQTGTSNSFPFDKYLDEFDISGVLTSDTGGVEFINLRTDYTGTFDSFDANVHVTSYNSKSTFSLEIVRTGTTRFFSISVILLMWALSFTILTLSVTIWIRNRVVEPPVIFIDLIHRQSLLLQGSCLPYLN
jgi:hypothetical protein